MSQTTTSQSAGLFQLSAETHVQASAAAVYTLVSDLPNSGRWSPECQGGAWVEGEPATVGAVFRGENLRSEDIVAWAPVVRGTWNTYAEVVAAEPEATFQWAMRDRDGNTQESVWAFDIEAVAGGSRLVHRFWMGQATEGIREIIAEMDDAAKQRFFSEWGEKIREDLGVTLRRIKAIAEQA